MMGTKIEERKLDVRHGTYGPRHDPYAWEERIVTLNGVTHKLHLGLDCYYSVDGKEVAGYRIGHPDGPEAVEVQTEKMWEQAVGMTSDQFDEAYDRINPYFDDPIGHPSMYK